MFLTGIKPTGEFHLGNYISIIKGIKELLKVEDIGFIFIADIHAMNQKINPEELNKNILRISRILLSFFEDEINSGKIYLYRQSKINEIFKLGYILNNFCQKSILNRSHVYKVLCEKNIENNKDIDEQINMGLFNYPVLMASDILLFNADIVPIGQDQKSHLNNTKEIARVFNNFVNTKFFKNTKAYYYSNDILLGTDGRKMSKSYNNIIPLFNTNKRKKIINSIATNEKLENIPKFENESYIFEILKHFFPNIKLNITYKEYLKLLSENNDFDKSWKSIKQLLNQIIDDIENEVYKIYNFYENEENIKYKLQNCEEYISKIAKEKMQKIEHLIGIN